MMDFEQNLRNHLQNKASEVYVTPNIDSIEKKPHMRSRTPLLSIAPLLTGVLLIGALGGFLGGHESVNNVSAAKSGETTIQGNGALSPNVATGSGGPSTTRGASGIDQPAYSLLKLVSLRTTSSGITIRTYSAGCLPSMNNPSGSCSVTHNFINQEVVVEMSNSKAVGTGYALLSSSSTALSYQSGGEFGQSEGSPVFWLVASASSDVAKVTWNSSNGQSDTTSPTDGIATLAVNGVGSANGLSGTLQAFNSQGALLETVSVPPSTSTCPPMESYPVQTISPQPATTGTAAMAYPPVCVGTTIPSGTLPPVTTTTVSGTTVPCPQPPCTTAAIRCMIAVACPPPTTTTSGSGTISGGAVTKVG
ncbi:MAG: hypothetical protein HKL80_04255 [Acidimicrobiales bacterium]|nr:hypothetical protein [Acidimicrobiales bacterium]